MPFRSIVRHEKSSQKHAKLVTQENLELNAGEIPGHDGSEISSSSVATTSESPGRPRVPRETTTVVRGALSQTLFDIGLRRGSPDSNNSAEEIGNDMLPSNDLGWDSGNHSPAWLQEPTSLNLGIVLRSNNSNCTISYAYHVRITWPIFFFFSYLTKVDNVIGSVIASRLH
jgi:hypothetical protein